MTTPIPGWYPDPERPGLERWFDGAAWTRHVRTVPAPVTSTSGGTKPPWSGGKIVGVSLLSVLGALLVLGGLAAISIPVAVDQRARELFADAVHSASCPYVASEEERLSREGASASDPQLVDIVEVRTVEDHLSTAERPGTGGSTHLLTCEATAVWDDGMRTPVRLTLTIDSDNQMWIDGAWDETSTDHV